MRTALFLTALLGIGIAAVLLWDDQRRAGCRAFEAEVRRGLGELEDYLAHAAA